MLMVRGQRPAAMLLVRISRTFFAGAAANNENDCFIEPEASLSVKGPATTEKHICPEGSIKYCNVRTQAGEFLIHGRVFKIIP
jgi:hypothetical protein